jgi:biotin synthase
MNLKTLTHMKTIINHSPILVMCYAIPGLVTEIKGKLAIIDYFGEKRQAVADLESVGVGDYVYAQGGFIVQSLPKEEAEPILKEWEKRFFELKEIDNKISSREVGPSSKEIQELLAKPFPLEREELLTLLKTQEVEALFKAANSLRAKRLKNSCCVHGIIEFSNHCRNNCSYCGIRNSSQIPRYRMTPEEVIERAKYAVEELGFKALVLQSGEDESYTTEMLCEIIREVRKLGTLIFMSVGSRPKEDYKKMYEAGARGILLRFETSNPSLYKSLHSGPKANLEERIELIKYSKSLGYIIATGSIIGLPGQTEEDLLNDILLARSLGTEMYSFGPLIPHQETPLSNSSSPPLDLVLKTLAVTRLADPEAKILVTTALETLDPDGRRKGLLAGANSLMINTTPTQYREKYLIYPGRTDKEITQNIASTLKLLYSLGRAPTDLGL